MRLLSIGGVLLFATAAVVNGSPECRFAPTFTQSDLINDKEVRNDFQRAVIKAEARFMRELGFDQATGLTRTAIQLNHRTGMPLEGSKGSLEDEAIHLGILAKVLDGQG